MELPSTPRNFMGIFVWSWDFFCLFLVRNLKFNERLLLDMRCGAWYIYMKLGVAQILMGIFFMYNLYTDVQYLHLLVYHDHVRNESRSFQIKFSTRFIQFTICTYMHICTWVHHNYWSHCWCTVFVRSYTYKSYKYI